MPSEVDQNLDKDCSRGDLCLKIDAAVIQFFSILTQLYRVQAELECLMKSGFLSLSRARYSMGAKFVSSQQFDENKMEASVKVKVGEGQGLEELVLQKITDLDLEDVAGDKTTTEDSASSGLRKRNILSKEKDESAKQEKVEDISSTKERQSDEDQTNFEKDCELVTVKKPFDPIKWFGVLVPPALRQSQKDFRDSVEKSVILANLKKQLTSVQKEYTELLLRKQKLFPDSDN